MNGEFDPVYSTNNIWRDDNMLKCLTVNLEDIESDIETLQSGKSDTSHTHSYNDLTNKPTALPANGGDADTVDGKHASDFATADHTHSVYESKYSKPSTGIPKSDLASDVQSSLAKADSALQSYTETDPTVPAWAKATTKPTYTASEVGAMPSTTTLADLSDDTTHRTVTDAEKASWSAKSTFSGSYNDLTDKPTIPSAITIDSALSSTSTNPVQNKVVNAALDGKANSSHVHNVFSNLTDAGITTFPTTMQYIAMNIPANSMIIIDTRRINGANTTYSTQTISDWGNTTNGVAIIQKGLNSARVSMMIIYGSSAATYNNIVYGNYAIEGNKVNWTSLKDQLDDKIDKVKTYSAVDLNTITTSGLYYVSSETAALHCPVGSNGHMLVMSDGTRVRQVFFRVGTVDTTSFQWYSRHLGSDPTVGDNGWSQWWLLSGCELAWSGTATLNAEINLGSRYGCQAWVVAGQATDTGTYSTVYIPRYFLTTNTTKYKLQIADETGYVSFYFYYKTSDDNVYAKIVWVSDSNNSALKYVYRVS